MASGLLALSLVAPGTVLANDVVASAVCDFNQLRVGQINHEYGAITYHASDWWVPKTGFYTTAWEWWPYFVFVVVDGNAPRGNVFKGVDPNFGRTSWRQDGTFTVWGDATKNLHTKAEAEFAQNTVLNLTTSGVGHTWDDWARCQPAPGGWVKITN